MLFSLFETWSFDARGCAHFHERKNDYHFVSFIIGSLSIVFSTVLGCCHLLAFRLLVAWGDTSRHGTTFGSCSSGHHFASVLLSLIVLTLLLLFPGSNQICPYHFLFDYEEVCNSWKTDS
jgi:hypothetical protein